MSSERIRAFVAIPLPEVVRVHLSGVQDELRRDLPESGLRYTKPEQFHLTLSFLGDIEPWQAEAVAELLRKLAAGTAPFELETAGLGAFPNPRRPSVLWLGVAGDLSELQALQTRLETGLGNLDLTDGKGDYRPHLTLARIKGLSPTLRAQVAGLLGREPEAGRVGWHADRVQLIRSQLSPQGPNYSVLAEVHHGG